MKVSVRIASGRGSNLTGQNSVRISGKEDRIIIDGITEGYVWIYDINGVLVTTMPATGECMEIRLQERGIYLVKYAGRTVKVKI